MQNITKWDSLNHIGLISAIEENFDINFKDDEIIDMINYDSIIKKIKKYKKNIKISYVISPIMNQLSYHVSKEKLFKKGLRLNSNLEEEIVNTLKLFKNIKK